MLVFVTGGTVHVGAYVISDLIAAGHEVVALARSDASAVVASALGAKVRRGDLADLEALEAAAVESDGVIHLGYRGELLPTGGISALGESELAIVLAFGKALAGTDTCREHLRGRTDAAGLLWAPGGSGRARPPRVERHHPPGSWLGPRSAARLIEDLDNGHYFPPTDLS